MKRILISFIAITLLLGACDQLPGQNAGSGEGTTDVNSLFPAASPTATITPTPTPQARIIDGEQELINGDYDQALQEFQTVVTTSDDQTLIAAGQVGIGKVYFFQQNYEGAVNQFNWILGNFPNGEPYSIAQFYLARSYDALGEYQLAADAYGNYLNQASGLLNSEILTLQGDALVNAGNPAGAIPLYQQALTTAVVSKQENLSIKLAQTTEAAGSTDEALTLYQQIYDSSSSDYTRAQMDYLMGLVYLDYGQNEDAYAKFQDAVLNFPTSNDTYLGLLFLTDANQPVPDLNRGIVDYFAGQYGLAVQWLDRYIQNTPEHDGTPHYYRALSYWKMGLYEEEIAEWDQLIQGHPTDEKYATAFLEKSSTQKLYLNLYDSAAQTLLEFIALQPAASQAPQYLYEAGRIYESENRLDKAAKTWMRIIDEYPGAEEGYTGLFEAGICYYRLGDFTQAQVIFQRTVLLATVPADKAAAALWVAKTLQAQKKDEEARGYLQQAVEADPTGYYSIRADQILNGEQPFTASAEVDLGISLKDDMESASRWMAQKFNLPAGTDLTSLGDMADNPLFQRGDLFLQLGFTDDARSEFETLRQELQDDSINTFRLANYLVNAGLYRSAIFSSRQVLDQAGLSEAATLTAPKFFNHIRFGVYYRDTVVSSAVEHNMDPLLLFSIIRQESMFEGAIISSAGARGLMQIMPAVGEEIAGTYGWPPNYTEKDLLMPIKNVRMGTHYLKKWVDYFGGDMTAALAAYNGGIGNAMEWKKLSGNDPDLFLEIIRYSETRDYIRYITENYEIYKSIYTHP